MGMPPDDLYETARNGPIIDLCPVCGRVHVTSTEGAACDDCDPEECAPPATTTPEPTCPSP